MAPPRKRRTLSPLPPAASEKRPKTSSYRQLLHTLQEKESADQESSDDEESELEDEKEEEEEKEDEKKGGKRFWVYVLESVASPHYSYVGFTVDRARRLRQHNGELASGGAKYTKLHRPWRMVLSIEAQHLNNNNNNNNENEWWTKSAALQLEWRVKHVTKGRSRRRPKLGNPGRQRWKTLRLVDRPAVERRVNDIFWLLHNRKRWTSNAPEWNPTRALRIEMLPSLATPQIKLFAQQCAFWKPSIHPLAI